jgi:predicted CXXCH cytochrome family protein
VIFQIKRFRKTADETIADGEVSLDQNTLTLGASNEQNVIIEWPGVRLRHAELYLSNGELRVRATTDAGVKINNKTVTDTALKQNDKILLGNHQLAVSQSNDSVTVEVTVDETLTAPSQPLYKTRLAHTGFSKRKWSWMFLLLIGSVFFAAPYISRYADIPPTTTEYLPTDRLWNTGSFHPAHQFFANDCSQCHQTPFQQVQNSACMACHQEMGAHAPATEFPQAELQEAACLSCHKEHNGSNELVTSDKQLCVSCHANIESFTHGTTTQETITDWEFSHPEISLKMAKWDAIGKDWQWSQQPASDPGPELSGIIFPHDVHLRPEGFGDDYGNTKVLECSDCHQPEAGGKLMQPINMEQHCQSCHRLDFDIDQPELFVRHGNVAATLRDIAGQKGLDALKPALETPPPELAEPTLLRPGKSREYKQQEFTLVQLAGELIEKRGCIGCHGVSRNDQAIESGDLINGWQINPVHINRQWIDLAEFDHSGHKSIDCVSCHTGAHDSDKASDVLIPARENCSSCHGNPGNSELTDSQCIDCHSYHLPQHGWLPNPDDEKAEHP